MRTSSDSDVHSDTVKRINNKPETIKSLDTDYYTNMVTNGKNYVL